MNLYHCTVEISLIVQAETPELAESHAEDIAKNGADGCDVVTWTTPMDSIDDVPKGWLDSLPFCGNGHATVKQILEIKPQ